MRDFSFRVAVYIELDVMPKDGLEKFELHDALIHRTVIDHDAETIEIHIAYYRSPDDSKRRRAVLRFEGVTAFSQAIDAAELKTHRFAGHISYWRPSSKRGTTFIYLATGTMTISARSAAVKVRA